MEKLPFSSYQECIDYLYSKLPIFQRVGAAAYKPGLENTHALMGMMDHPEKKFKSIHVAGTNGKGSTSHFLASIFQETGLKVGLYTSPHLQDFRERVRINGVMMEESYVLSFVNQYHPKIEAIEPSFFELCVALAFKYFADQKVDLAIVEVGMGGRLDSTNVIHPELCLITNISYDHMQFLGDTLPKIAFEKAGIIKENTPVVVSQYQPECAAVFQEQANQKNAPLEFAEHHWELHKLTDQAASKLNIEARGYEQKFVLNSGLVGDYQMKNLRGVLSACRQMLSLGWQLDQTHIESGIEKVIENTQLRGRWEKLQEQPTIIADTAHNEDGIQEVLKQLKNYSFKQLHWVWGMVNDKDPAKVMKLLPTNAKYYFCKPNIPRGLDAEECQRLAKNYSLIGESYKSVAAALEAAKQAAAIDDFILIAGSTFVVAESI